MERQGLRATLQEMCIRDRDFSLVATIEIQTEINFLYECVESRVAVLRHKIRTSNLWTLSLIHIFFFVKETISQGITAPFIGIYCIIQILALSGNLGILGVGWRCV